MEPRGHKFVPALVSPSSTGRTSTSTCRAARTHTRADLLGPLLGLAVTGVHEVGGGVTTTTEPEREGRTQGDRSDQGDASRVHDRLAVASWLRIMNTATATTGVGAALRAIRPVGVAPMVW